MIRIREASVAGSFYPATRAELRDVVQRLLDAAPSADGAAPSALVVPHAGYRYSGAVAAAAYAQLLTFRARYRRVALFGPSHYWPLDGIATSSADAFRTPLGDVPLDRERLDRLDLPGVVDCEPAHAREHSLEVQLPFLQVALDDFALLPFAVGRAPPERVAALIDWVGFEPGTLAVVSSDLSHFLHAAQARRLDRATCAAIEALRPERISDEGACGAAALRGLLLTARRRGLRAQTLSLAHSGEITGDAERVVGYGAWVFRENAPGTQRAA